MLGGQAVTVVSVVPTGEVSEIGVPQTSEVTNEVTGCLFEIQDASSGSTESQSDTTVITETAWCLMPVTPVTAAITSHDAIRHGGKVYQMRGDARVEYDLDGVPDHVFALCQWQEG